jgi:hypothetical protein
MLAADKLQLQSALKQQATALKEKEFNLHHSNFMTVGTQAAVLAGLNITMFIEFDAEGDDRWPADYVMIAAILRCIYNTTIVGAFCANILVVSHTTILSVNGASLALRGPDGSMMVATDGLYEERRRVFTVFAYGLALTVGAVLVAVWLLLRWETALICWIVTSWTSRQMYRNYCRIMKKFDYDERDTVDFRDIFDGPAAIRGVPVKKRHSRKKKTLNQSTHSLPDDGILVGAQLGGSNTEMQALTNGDSIKRRGGKRPSTSGAVEPVLMV